MPDALDMSLDDIIKTSRGKQPQGKKPVKGIPVGKNKPITGARKGLNKNKPGPISMDIDAPRKQGGPKNQNNRRNIAVRANPVGVQNKGIVKPNRGGNKFQRPGPARNNAPMIVRPQLIPIQRPALRQQPRQQPPQRPPLRQQPLQRAPVRQQIRQAPPARPVYRAPVQPYVAPAPQMSHYTIAPAPFPAPAPSVMCTKLLINNLHPRVTEDDVKELFGTCGKLINSFIHFNSAGQSRGTAEVIFVSPADAKKAYDSYHNVALDGRKMHIDLVPNTSLTTLTSGILVSRPTEQPMNRSGIQFTRTFQHGMQGVMPR